MPSLTEKQHRAMEAAAHGHSTLGIPKKVGEEFVAADATAGHAAGVLFVAPDGSVLFLRRGQGETNYAGHWALPGGKVDDGETPEQGADREVMEEVGFGVGGKKKLMDQRITPNKMAFHTFAQASNDKFDPVLNDEHDGFVWAPLDKLPRPLHPSVERTLVERLHDKPAADMTPEDWDGLRIGFAKWVREEEAEPEHAKDAGWNEGDHPRDEDGKFGSGSHSDNEKNRAKGFQKPTVSRLSEKDEARLKSVQDDFLNRATQDQLGNYIVEKKIKISDLNTVQFGVSKGKVTTLAKRMQMENTGGLKPVVVDHFEGRYVIVDGNHRIEAAIKNGNTEIFAEVCDMEKWQKEQMSEKPAQDMAMDRSLYDATGKRIMSSERMAFDFQSVRSYDADGHLHVSRTPISKANVCEYYGHEIPDAETLGLDPQRRYALLRDPDELAKAAKSSNGKQLLIKHTPVDADDHQPDLTVGAVGTDAEFVAPFLYNSLTVHAREGITAIESGKQKELSSAYRYRADMTPGTYLGAPYDGVMRDIDFNHVALVPEGRAGADVVVGDSKPNGETFMKTVLSRKGTFLAGAIAAYLAPRLAQDCKIDVSSFFQGVTTKNFKDKKATIAADIKSKVTLAKDAELDHIEELLDKLERQEVAEGADADPNSGLPMNADEMEAKKAEDKKAKDAAGKEFLKGKLSAEDLKAYDDMMGEVDEAEDGETKEAKANGEGAEDEDDDKEPKVSKKAMDAAIAKATTEATANALRTANEISQAKDVAAKWVGRLAMDAVAASDVYKAALDHLKVKIEGVHPSAFRSILEVQPVPGAAKETTIAQDGVLDLTGFNKRHGGIVDRIALS